MGAVIYHNVRTEVEEPLIRRKVLQMEEVVILFEPLKRLTHRHICRASGDLNGVVLIPPVEIHHTGSGDGETDFVSR